MTDQDQPQLPPAPYGVELIGPFVSREPYRLVVDGCRVPHVEFFKQADGNFEACVDGRMSVLDLAEAEIQKWGHVLANAMAVSAGLSHFGPDAKAAPFASRMIGVSGARVDEPRRAEFVFTPHRTTQCWHPSASGSLSSEVVTLKLHRIDDDEGTEVFVGTCGCGRVFYR